MEDWGELLRKRMMGDYSAAPSDKHKVVKSKATSSENRLAIVDLHISEIPEYVKQAMSATALEIQLSYADEQVKAAISKKQKSIILIHGLGEGTLEKALKKRFGNHSKVQLLETLFVPPYRGNAIKLHFK